MKTIKIIIFLLIMNVLIFSTIGVFATDTTATLNVNNSEVKPGDKIKVTLNVNCTEGIGFIGTKINYDSSILTLESQDINNKLINYGTDKLELFSNSSEKLTNITACTFVFKVNERIDRSINQNINEHVIFDTDNQDILTSTFMHNVADEKNVGLVVGEDQMDSSQTAKIRVKLPVGDDTLSGYNRKEIYIDARDLQSEYENNTGTVENMSDEEYANLLADRGAKKLAENVAVQSFEANIRYYYSQYEYGVDYSVGDVVTFIDRDMGVTVSAFISEVEQVFTDYYELRLSIGYDRPTIYSRIARMLNT